MLKTQGKGKQGKGQGKGKGRGRGKECPQILRKSRKISEEVVRDSTGVDTNTAPA